MKNIYITVLLLLCTYCSFAVGPITGSWYVCVGGTAPLSNSTPGGVWSCSSPYATIDATTGIVTGISNGYAVITYTESATSVTTGISVRRDTINAPSSICLGSSVFLFDSNALYGPAWGAVWNVVSGSLAMTDSSPSGIAIKGVTIGTGVVSYSDYWGCVSTYSIAVTPATCTGTPVAGTATIDAAPCRGIVVLLRLAGYTDCGTEVQWQSSTDGVTWVDVAGATTAKTRVNPIVVTHYRCKVSCISSGLVAFSNTVTRSFSSPIQGHTIYESSTDCSANFTVWANGCTSTSNFRLINKFGDGIIDTVSEILPNFTFSHAYSLPGTYTIKHILYDDSFLVDSTSYSYAARPCDYFPIRVYSDVNGNGLEDVGDFANTIPIAIRVDSNGVIIDTITITSGINYSVFGSAAVGSVYKFSPIPMFGMAVLSPLSGFVLYTVTSSGAHAVKYFGVHCSTIPTSTDLGGYSFVQTGRHAQVGDITVNYGYCLPLSASVSLAHSPKYTFHSAIPPPSSISGNVITWNLPISGSAYIYYHLERPAPWLTPGDTVHSLITISPTADVNPSNNIIIRVDTVKSSWDPNDITVSPAGDIPNNTTLQYTVRFENTGNDTAHNIYVLDTLPSNVDPRTLDIVSASAAMYLSITNIGGYNIAKFDFPNIKLLDSSYHGLNTGMFVFKIKTRPGLTDGTYIPNRVGIYFDDNEVVLTNTASNTILIPSVSIAATGGTTVCEGAAATFTALAHSFTPIHYRWFVNGAVTGTDNSTFTSTSLHHDDSVTCQVVNASGDSILAASNTIGMFVNPLPPMPALSGASVVCVGGAMIINATTAGGTWSASNGNATVSAGGRVTAVSAGIVHISYTVSNSCGVTTATHEVSVDALPSTPSITGASSVCVGSSALLSAGLSTGTWSAANGNATVVNGNVTGLSTGMVFISFTVTNSCGTAMATHLVSVSPLPDAGVISGGESVRVNATTSLTASIPGGTWTADNGNVTISPSGEVTGVSIGTTTISYQVSNACGSEFATHTITIEPSLQTAPVKGVSVSPNPADKEISVGNAKGGVLRILNLLGQEVYSDKLSQDSQQINIASLANGTYMIHVIGQNGEKTTVRLVKQ